MKTLPTIVAVGLLLVAGGIPEAQAQVQAQEAPDGPAVSGHVLDARTGAPVWGAFVGLFPAQEGVLTDSLGFFSLPVPMLPSYNVVAEQLGYSDGLIAVSADELEGPVEIRVEPDPVALEQLEVVAERFTRERNSHAGPVAYFDQDHMLSQVGQTAFDVAVRYAHLRPCSRSVVEEWCTYSRGSVVPTRVYIDEIPVVWDGMSWLRDYDAREIYLLEVYDFGRVIRVLTRWGVEERPEQIAALRTLPMVPAPWEMTRRGRFVGSLRR